MRGRDPVGGCLLGKLVFTFGSFWRAAGAGVGDWEPTFAPSSAEAPEAAAEFKVIRFSAVSQANCRPVAGSGNFVNKRQGCELGPGQGGAAAPAAGLGRDATGVPWEPRGAGRWFWCVRPWAVEGLALADILWARWCGLGLVWAAGGVQARPLLEARSPQMGWVGSWTDLVGQLESGRCSSSSDPAWVWALQLPHLPPPMPLGGSGCPRSPHAPSVWSLPL